MYRLDLLMTQFMYGLLRKIRRRQDGCFMVSRTSAKTIEFDACCECIYCSWLHVISNVIVIVYQKTISQSRLVNLTIITNFLPPDDKV